MPMQRPTFEAILAARLTRRTLVTTAGTVGLAACARIPTQQPPSGTASSFKSVAPSSVDDFLLASGYRYNFVARWGDSLVTGTPDFDTRDLADNSWLNAAAVDAQHRQFGANCDAVQYFPLVQGRAASGLVCVNHEYFSAEMVWQGHRGVGMKAEDRKRWMAEHPQATAFMQAAQGVTVAQLKRDAGGWVRDLDSRYTRRITANTPMEICGPARGHRLMRTRADPDGVRVLGTFANCSAGKTPWGTYRSEERRVGKECRSRWVPYDS